MRNNTELHFVISQEVPDGMGGYLDNGEVKGTSFKAYKQPIKRENVMKEYGITTKKPFRVVTNQNLQHPLESSILSDGRYKYEILEHLDLKYSIFLIEEIGEVSQ